MFLTKITSICGVVMIMAAALFADTAILKDGKVLQGTFKGGNETIIKFESGGKITEIPLANLTTLTFSARAATARFRPAPEP